ncbi:MAG: beta-sandwich domain-containing protein [Bdellovibrionales bacterium]|nr:beta-sandwich domain-containing protein [Bdellovibrionales bacterium]
MLTTTKRVLAAALALSSLVASNPSLAALEGSARINQVTRKSGGQLYRAYLASPISLSRVSIDVLSAKAKIHDAAIVTASMASIPLYNLQETAVIPAGKSAVSEYINRNDLIIAVDVQAESFGAVADLRLRVASEDGAPKISAVIPQDSSGSLNPAPPSSPQPPPYYPQPTPPPPPPPPTPTPPEVVYLSYPFSNRGNQKISCSATDKGWEEHWGGHGSCGECLKKHGECIETCTATDVVVYGTGYDVYGRIAKFEGRGGDSYDARRDMQQVCDYYRLTRCESDPGKSDSTNSDVVSRRSCK